jgi:hypothetical protein
MTALNIQNEYETWRKSEREKLAEASQLITLKEFCKRTSTAESTARQWISTGVLRAVSANSHHLRIPVSEIERIFRPVQPTKVVTGKAE